MTAPSGSGGGSRRLPRAIAAAGLLALVAAFATPAWAEPVFALRTGYSCAQCHVNRVGGGMRTPFGSLYTQTTLPANLLRWKDETILIPADPRARFAYGGDARFGYYTVRSTQTGDTGSFELTAAQIYGQLRLVPGRFSLYVDQKIGSGASSTREAFALVSFGDRRGYVKLGKVFPVYGWAIPDDDAFIREPLGFGFSGSDVGVELGFDPGNWSTQLAVVNGNAGQRDVDSGKKFTFLTTRRFRLATIGLTYAWDDAAGRTTSWGGVVAGLNFGRFSILAERDARRSRTDDPAGETRTAASYAEVNLLIRRGLNLKFTHDWIDPSRAVRTDRRQRDALGIEYIPYPFVQMRVFLRRGDGPPQVAGTRGSQADIEVHFFF